MNKFNNDIKGKNTSNVTAAMQPEITVDSQQCHWFPLLQQCVPTMISVPTTAKNVFQQ
jgi:hypothetical protein